MIRIGAFFVGLFFAGWLLVSALMGAFSFITAPPAATAEHEFHMPAKSLSLSSDGPFGKYDQAQLQRGFQVYKEVCSACHSLKLVAFRDLKDLGYDEGQLKTIANGWAVETPTIDQKTGDAITRKSLPADKFPSPYANEVAARAANNNALPPDLSLMAKARHGGSAYIYSLLTGYQKPPAKLAKEFPASMPGKTTYYNPYFANLNLAMPAPLTSDGQVTYDEGAPKPTVEQMSKDVTAFLTWTAEPKLEARHQVGQVAVLFLLIFGWLCWQAYQNVWADKKRKA